MQIELMALGVQVVLFIVTSILGYRILMREKRDVLAMIDVKIQTAIDEVGTALQEVFQSPVIKRSLTHMANMGGDAMQNKSIMNKMALDVLDGPKLQALKAAAKMGLNIDVDQYIEENGAIETLQAAQGLGELVGIDVTKLLGGGLNGANLAVGSEANGTNYYLRR